MDTRATVKALMDSLQMGDFENAKSLLAEDFQFSGPFPEPINAEAWLGMSMHLKKAFPDLNYHFRVESVQSEGVVKVSSELKAARRDDLHSASMNLGVVPAANKSFAPEREHGRIIVRDDKVVSWVVKPAKGAGWMAMLVQFGS